MIRIWNENISWPGSVELKLLSDHGDFGDLAALLTSPYRIRVNQCHPWNQL
jgi:hypothetical protein